MTAYYNEFDPFAAQWLRNLIAAGHIAPGDVDERSIKDVKADDLKKYTQAHFFAGIGVWSHALRLAGWGDDRPVWTGSCPCQPFSAAGKRQGTADDRHLWPVWYDLIRQCRPPIIFGEQVASSEIVGRVQKVQRRKRPDGFSPPQPRGVEALLQGLRKCGSTEGETVEVPRQESISSVATRNPQGAIASGRRAAQGSGTEHTIRIGLARNTDENKQRGMRSDGGNVRFDEATRVERTIVGPNSAPLETLSALRSRRLLSK